jgi:uncharacterized protein (TIGR02001 family)
MVSPRLVAFGALFVLAAPAAWAAELGGSATITSDYVWRGTSQTEGDPALQAGMKIASARGLYASAWGSNVAFAPGLDASTEMDLALGWAASPGDAWGFDAYVLQYRYPSTTVNLDWVEWNATVNYRDRVSVSVGWSHQALGSDGPGTYLQVGGRKPIRDAFRFEATLAHYFLDDAIGGSYSFGNASAIWSLRAPFELRVTAHATDGDARTLFGDDVAGSRIEAALQASF